MISCSARLGVKLRLRIGQGMMDVRDRRVNIFKQNSHLYFRYPNFPSFSFKLLCAL